MHSQLDSLPSALDFSCTNFNTLRSLSLGKLLWIQIQPETRHMTKQKWSDYFFSPHTHHRNLIMIFTCRCAAHGNVPGNRQHADHWDSGSFDTVISGY